MPLRWGTFLWMELLRPALRFHIQPYMCERPIRGSSHPCLYLSVLSSLLVCQLYGAQLLDEYIIPFTLSCIIHHVSILGTGVCSLSCF